MKSTKVFEGDPRMYAILPIQGDSKHSQAKCLNKVKNSDGLLCNCTYECRSDHLREAIKKGSLHICKPGTPIGLDISKFFKDPASSTGSENFSTQSLLERLITFIGRKNISMTVGASDEFYELLAFAFACGAKHGNKNHPLESAHDFIPHLGRDKLTDLFIKTANKIHENTMNFFNAKHIPYVSVAIDEGSTMSRKLLDFCLENPEYKNLSYPGATVRMPDTTYESYNRAILAGLREMDHYNIKFAALIIDGGKGQAKALNDQDPLSLISRTNIPWITALLIIPCICHRTNNAFKSACSKTDNGLNNLVDFIHSLPERLNQHVKEIGATCPRHTATRWTCDFFICDFVKNHYAKCSQFAVFGAEFEEFYNVAEIFYAMIQMFEDPKCSLASVFPILKDGIDALDQLTEQNNRYSLIFKISLERYTLESKDKGIWALAYMFTPKGREETKHLLNDRNYHRTHRLVEKFYVKKKPRPDAIDDGVETLIHESVSNASDIPTEDVTDDDFGIPRVNIDKNLAALPEGTIVEEMPEPTPEELEDMLASPANSTTHEGIEYLKKALRKIGCPASLIARNENAFKSYLYSITDPFPLRVTPSGHLRYDWPLIRDNGGEWRFLADLALRLESCCAAEASCERTITAQRLILTAHTLRSDKKLLEARLTFLKGFEK